jgi:hypothetical protein
VRRVLAGILAVLSFAIPFARANTFFVINTNDGGAGSLRQAIVDANNNPGFDTIAFAIPGVFVHTIKLIDDLPTIIDQVLIDGYTEPGSMQNTLAEGDNAVLLIEIDGSSPAVLAALDVQALGSTIRGLVVNGAASQNGYYGIYVNAPACVIEGCFVGTDPTGTIARPNKYGIELNSYAGDRIGGTTPTARNIISGNGTVGIDVLGSDNALIQGNFIGVDASGASALPNGNGVDVFATTAFIGGTSAGVGNIISGNNLNGILLDFDSSHNVIQGNFIGTDVTGTQALGNGQHGISMVGEHTFSGGSNLIGGTQSGAGNVISANGHFGLYIHDEDGGDVVQGNSIGTNLTGSIALGNGHAGIVLDRGGNNAIGGTSAGNIIAHNGSSGGEPGVSVAASTNNLILSNSIFDNGGLGIDLGGDGVTANDTGDGDTGANNLQNFPVITGVDASGGMTTVNGRLNSAANTTYHIEVFANDAIDSTGYGEGQSLIGAGDCTTDVFGNGSFIINNPFTQIGAGQRVTATATDPNNNTSEFSGAIGQLLNASTRMQVQTGNNVLIAGFIVSGSGNTNVLSRALGPTLSQFGVTGVLANPTLDLVNGNTLIASNDNWKDMQQADIAATGLAPPNDLEAAILHNFTAGSYTAVVRGKNNTTGVSLVEVYDIDKKVDTTITNISTRGFVSTGQNVMIGGIISGNGIVRIIVRALGPTLSQFGVPMVLADPILELRDVNGTLIMSNDNWKDSQQAEIQASGKAPPNDNESAIIIVRPAANTTAIVRGKNNTTGNALVDTYVLPP